MAKAKFQAALIEGHKGVTVVIVPFDPEEVWSKKPMRLAGRRHGWVISGTANRARFDGYIGDRWGNFFVIIDGTARSRSLARAATAPSIAVATAAAASPAARWAAPAIRRRGR